MRIGLSRQPSHVIIFWRNNVSVLLTTAVTQVAEMTSILWNVCFFGMEGTRLWDRNLHRAKALDTNFPMRLPNFVRFRFLVGKTFLQITSLFRKRVFRTYLARNHKCTKCIDSSKIQKACYVSFGTIASTEYDSRAHQIYKPK